VGLDLDCSGGPSALEASGSRMPSPPFSFILVTELRASFDHSPAVP
jgi:hypothetical protein